MKPRLRPCLALQGTIAWLLLLSPAVHSAAQNRPPTPSGTSASSTLYTTPHAPLLGSAWYPEQWPEARWDADLALMEQAHFTVVRMGEFAWSTLEPSDNHFDLDWLDRAITLAAKHHLVVVLGTPTDAPPAWLTTKYPETLGVNADGHTREHGGRRQFNYASPRYRELCRRIAAEMAKRFGHNPAVLGWQIGNEYTDESFDPATRSQFQQFLKAKYDTLANLNARWTTSYWSQTYTDWSQIPLPRSGGNPGLLLEHKHFVTATWRSFQREQIDVLRRFILPAQFITTNIGGLAWSDNWDHYAISGDLDLASWDDYVGQGQLDATKNAMLNDFVRGWRRQNFWVMETQPGSVNWAPVNNALSPGATRALAWQTVGHGADAVLYWQWRAALNGQEQYHGAVVGPDGNPLPLFPELTQLGSDFAKVNTALAGTSPHSEIALLHTYDSRWALDFQPHTSLYDQQKVLLRFYAPLSHLAQAAGQQVDLIDPTQQVDLARYKLLVAPSLNVIDDALAEKLLAYVRAGGHLLLGPRSGLKDAYDALNPQRQPGPLAAALGATVAQFYALDKPVALQSDHEAGRAETWAEALAPTSASTHIDLRYSDPAGWLDQQPAMLTSRLDRGTFAYLGTLPDNQLLSAILSKAAHDAGLTATQAMLSSGVELCVRTGDRGHRVFILINQADAPGQALLSGAFRSLLNDGKLTLARVPRTDRRITSANSTLIDLPAQGVAVLLNAPNP